MNRPIAAAEAEIVTWMLRQASVGGPHTHLESTIPSLRIVRHCECGCPTVDFAVPTEEGYTVLAEGLGTSEDGTRMGIIVFGTTEAISCLEFYEIDRTVRSLPRVDSLEGW